MCIVLNICQLLPKTRRFELHHVVVFRNFNFVCFSIILLPVLIYIYISQRRGKHAKLLKAMCKQGRKFNIFEDDGDG